MKSDRRILLLGFFLEDGGGGGGALGPLLEFKKQEILGVDFCSCSAQSVSTLELHCH